MRKHAILTEKNAARAWLVRFAARHQMTYSELVAATDRYLDTGQEYVGGNDFLNAEVPTAFWKHFETATGRPVDVAKREDFFRCSC